MKLLLPQGSELGASASASGRRLQSRSAVAGSRTVNTARVPAKAAPAQRSVICNAASAMELSANELRGEHAVATRALARCD